MLALGSGACAGWAPDLCSRAPCLLGTIGGTKQLAQIGQTAVHPRPGLPWRSCWRTRPPGEARKCRLLFPLLSDGCVFGKALAAAQGFEGPRFLEEAHCGPEAAERRRLALGNR